MSDVSTLFPSIGRNPDRNKSLHPDRTWIRVLRFGVGAFVLAALIQKTFDATLPGSDVDIGQLYSQFTVQSNLALGLVLVTSALLRRRQLPQWWDHLFGAVVVYLVMTGTIYAVLVAPPGEPWWSWDLYWPQLAHHRLAPVFVALDWLLVTRTVRGTWRRPLAWLGYPAAFLVFSWVRGALDGWYVYDFLDPTLAGGWPAALTTTAQVLAASLVMALLVHLTGNGRAALAAGRPQGEHRSTPD
ncbi:Pr6Pr family membrane protein [Arthrobacter sp. PAMC25284]|uniref:Pr6Pr family membrane protein n=1 Tax=Arthrobacter sp. PAMC25284 TaxID=2861279 RepID=UPI001C639756|nr:Pr6Pr family membrane protein [Arthrobacter sp. PAMC25284]QYF90722.1 Pr6Pr family membrane protein [Arthrobacter sp. PAMC25284]